MPQDKITLFKTTTCEKCKIASFILGRTLESMGIPYDSQVKERFVDTDTNAMVDMMMLNSIDAPVLVIGETVLRVDEATNAKLIKEALIKNGQGQQQ
ncbi:MAG: hypothetical protein ABSF36_07520 [Candidatus Methanomethylicaceae archaeon]|jgi:glutaredoxin